MSAPSLLPQSSTSAHHDHHHHHDHSHAHEHSHGHDHGTLARAHAGPDGAVQPSVYVINSDDFQLHPDGSYSYRYELSDGTFTFANADALGAVKGGYGYKDSNGEDVTLEYTAGKGGFVPNGAHLPALSADQAAAAADAAAAVASVKATSSAASSSGNKMFNPNFLKSGSDIFSMSCPKKTTYYLRSIGQQTLNLEVVLSHYEHIKFDKPTNTIHLVDSVPKALVFLFLNL